ncbi:MAG TPA: hypothetical protein PKZ01_12885 [Candidatus Hydrogenedentes bacterium]|nr:hypothetical protein [Candidatus Hydrogenedentota bacterium]
MAQARDLAKLRLSEVTQGADPAAARQAARRDPGVQTLRQFVEGPYREVWLSQRKSGNEVYKRPMVVFAEFLDKPLTDLKLGELERWRGTRREKGRKPATVNRDITSLKSAQNRACDWGYIEKTPSPN